jgi:D-sedoheptulose 7-phosphate isomerase
MRFSSFSLVRRIPQDVSMNSLNNREHLSIRVREHFIQSAELKCRTADVAIDSILNAINLVVNCYRSANKVLICGNGGSAADAQHMAAEFMNRLRGDFERPGLPAVALTTDTSFITSYANDIGYDGVFERQVLALGQSGDVLIGISTSGNSRNVVKAIHAARKNGLKTIGLCGEGGTLTGIVDHPVEVPSRDTQHVQETLLTIEHVICAAVEEILFAQS